MVGGEGSARAHRAGGPLLFHFLGLRSPVKPLNQVSSQPRCVSLLPMAGRPGAQGSALPFPLSSPQPCWFIVSSGTRPNAQPKSCTGCCMSLRSSSPWWVSSGEQPSPRTPPLWPSPSFQAFQAGTLGAGMRAQKSWLVRFPLGHLPPSSPPGLSSHDPCCLAQAWWRCSTTTGSRATRTCTACTAGVECLSRCSTLSR